MGNSGSVHNINWDSSAGGFPSGRSKSELNGYFQRPRHNTISTQDNETQTQSLLRRQHNQSFQKAERTKPFPIAATSEQFKVLPKIDVERHKLLRPTTNGMLLHAGGTISGRNKDDMRAPGLMQRSRTLIFERRDGDRESNSNEKVTMPVFQRSQTLLHLPYKDRGIEDQETRKNIMQQKNILKGEKAQHGLENQNLRHARSEPDFRNDLNKPTHARKAGLMDNANVPARETLTKATKLNKYNKKRKAPPAPSTTAVNSANLTKTSERVENSENIAHEKAPVTRRFRTNINIKSQQQQQQQQQKTSLKRTTQTASVPPTYRREKSCDAILLRNKEESEATAAEKRFSLGSKISDNGQHTKVNTTPITAPKQTSKIPQLKRTFYFGMQMTAAGNAKHSELQETRNSSKPVEKSKVTTMELQNDQTVLATPAIVLASEENSELNTLNYRLHNDNEHTKGTDRQASGDEEPQMNDNGISVHIRPALPRRQLEVPSFSPAAAWRMLTNAEEERHKQLTAKSSGNSMNCESPIQLRSKKLALEMEELRREQPTLLQKSLRKDHVQCTMAWTPQQDLEDDDDDDDINNEVNNDTSSSDDFDGAKDEEDGLLFFNANLNKGRNDTGSKNNDKNSLGVHMFSLSLPRDTNLDSPIQKKNLMGLNNNDKITGFSSLQKLKLTISGGNKCTCRTAIAKFPGCITESSTDQEVCEIHSCKAVFRSDNWVLHKTGTKEGANVNGLTSNNGKLLQNDVIPTVEPISLSYLTGGKHIMYLPDINTSMKDEEFEKSNQGLCKERTPTRETTKTASSRQRQRKKEARESLQDEIPVLRHQQSQSQVQQQTQRFSFQSTVRMLEKRKLSEKLSRDAEIREAQRKSELEAMKRVEEDFQRKRASEKANIRHQLRLYCSGSGNDVNMTSNIREQYSSLPVLHSNRQQHDNNNNKISARRAEPDGAAASPSPPFFVDTEPLRFVHQISHLPLKPLKRMDSDCGDSDLDVENNDIAHFNRTASMVEPYLQSFMK